MLERVFLEYSILKLRQSAGRVEECLARLTEEQVWARGSANENAIGNLVLHLCGNARQWVISGVGGAADQRDRDSEFTAMGGATIANLREHLRSTVSEAAAVMDGQTAETLERKFVVQSYQVTVMEAIYHVVEHFAGHAGQVIFAAKMLTGEDLGFYRHLRYPVHTEKTP